jgi:hypothetical protein
MSVDHLFDHWGDDHTDPSGTAWAGGTERWRVDLGRALTGLRHLRGSPEPGRVFSELAAVCVPAICDEMTIDVSEAGMHPYRIRRPAPSLLGVAAAGPSAGPMAAYGSGRVVLVGSTVTVTVGSLPCGGPDYTARLVGVWHTGYAPTEADATLLEVLADHASAVVHRERTTRGLTDPATAGHVGSALGDAQRVAAATGVLMALHHLSPAQARHLLTRASDRTARTLVQTADTVLHTGALPGNRVTPAGAVEDPEPS